jgi:hypothetical protein
VHIKPSGLPVGSKPAAAAAATTPQQQQQQQQQLPLQQLLDQLWSAKVPAAAQGPTAAAVVGSWYHQDVGFLSEVTFMSDGRCYWNRSNTSSSSGAEGASISAGASAVSSSGNGSSGSGNQAAEQLSEIWHGVWTMQEGGASTGKVKLVYIVEQKRQQQGQAGSQQQQQQQQQQQRVVSYQRSALDDTLVLDGLAHIKLGAA